MLPTRFQVNWPFGSGEEEKNRFSRWPPRGHLWFRIGTILAIFDEQVTPMFPSKFQISWFFVQRKRKIDFKDGRHRDHLGFSARNDFSYFFFIYKSPRCSAGFSVQEKKQNNKFRRRPPFPIGMILSIFWSTRHPDASYQVSSQLAQVCRRRRLLKQVVDATRRTRTTHDGRGTLTDHKSSPWSCSPAESSYNATQRKNNTRTTASERSVVKSTRSLNRFYFYQMFQLACF